MRINRPILIFLFWGLVTTGLKAQDAKYDLLGDFITMQNEGSDEAIKAFIKEKFHPEIYKKIKLEDHVAFHRQIIDEFGQLSYKVLKEVESTDTKLIVHLVRKHQPITKNIDLDPLDILVVEIDIVKSEPRYLSRGLGLGSLECELRKQRH